MKKVSMNEVVPCGRFPLGLEYQISVQQEEVDLESAPEDSRL